MHAQKIAIDFSHTSDYLAYDILEYIEKQQLEIPIIASYSNCRSIKDVSRNLPDDLIKEIFRRKGIIGLNLFAMFVGPRAEEFFLKHCDHFLTLGGADHLCFGADFFYADDFPQLHSPDQKAFFESYEDATCYQRLLEFFKNNLSLDESLSEKIAYKNGLYFLQNQVSSV